MRTIALAVVLVGSTVAVAGPLGAYLPRLRRITVALEGPGAPSGLGTRHDGWKLGGIVYWAPDDPSVWVPRRVGIGTTVNMARPSAWLLFVVPALVLAVYAAVT